MHRPKSRNIYNKKGADVIGQTMKNNRIFVSRYFGELRQNIFKI